VRYSKRYYLLHPWWAVHDFIIYECRWAWQRIFRGWDDRVAWDITSYLLANMPAWLRQLKEHQHGIPIDFAIVNDLGEYVANEEKWNNTLGRMIDGFEAARIYSEADYSVYKEALEIYRQRIADGVEDDSLTLYSDIVDELDPGGVRVERERTVALRAWDIGAREFIEHFFSLWD